LSIGQEAVAVGVCDPLRKDDILFGTYRDHATYLAKGGDLRKMMAELYGKATGCAKGKGGSMHLIDLSVGSMGASAIVGTTIPHAVDELRKSGTGPRFFEFMTYRMKEHVGPNDDYHQGYRSLDEADPWVKGDPVKRLAGQLPADLRAKIERAVEAKLRDAIEF